MVAGGWSGRRRSSAALPTYRLAEGVNGIVGRQLRLDGQVFDVVGVLPERFFFLNPEGRVVLPLAFAPEEFREDKRWSQNHALLARLAPGVTLDMAQARMDAHNAAVTERAGSLKDTIIRAGYQTRLLPLADDVVRNVRSALQVPGAVSTVDRAVGGPFSEKHARSSDVSERRPARGGLRQSGERQPAGFPR